MKKASLVNDLQYNEDTGSFRYRKQQGNKDSNAERARDERT